MEIKKSPRADLENKKSMFVLLGLVLALGFTYICFEWTNTEVTVHDDGAIQEFFNDGEEEIIPQTEQDQPKPEVTPPPATVAEQVMNVVDDDVKTEGDLKIQSSEDDTAKVVIKPVTPVDDGDDEEEADPIILVVEEKAEFPGGMQALMSFLKKELNYPQVAIDNNIQGRVLVEFVVNRDGSIQDIKIARGVDPILDQEAIRVVKKMPKWQPAKQSGKTCRSRFTLPILFKFK